MVSTKTTKKKVSSSKPSVSSSSCKYKKVGETKDSAHKCVYVKTGSGTGSGSDKTSKYYTASIVDGKRKYKVYNGEVKRVQKGRGGVNQRGWGLGDLMGCRGGSCTTTNVVNPKLRSNGGKWNTFVNNLNTNEQQQGFKQVVTNFGYITAGIKSVTDNQENEYYDLFSYIGSIWGQFLTFCTVYDNTKQRYHTNEDFNNIYYDFMLFLNDVKYKRIPMPNFFQKNNLPYNLFMNDIHYMNQLTSRVKTEEIESLNEITKKWRAERNILLKSIDWSKQNTNTNNSQRTNRGKLNNSKDVEYTVYIDRTNVKYDYRTTLPESIREYDTNVVNNPDRIEQWRHKRNNYKDFYIKYKWLVLDDNDDMVNIKGLDKPLSLYDAVLRCSIYVNNRSQKLQLIRKGRDPIITQDINNALTKISNAMDDDFRKGNWDELKIKEKKFMNTLLKRNNTNNKNNNVY